MSDKITKSPKMRFSGFTDALEQLSLGEVLIKNSQKNKDLAIENVESISNKTGFTKQTEQFDDYSVASADLSNYYVIREKQFAYNPSRINVGSIAYKAEGEEKSVVSPLYVSFSTTHRLEDSYLWNWVKTSGFERQRQTLSEGGVRDTLSFNQLAEMYLLAPNIEEQQKIGAFFKTLDDIITLHKRKLELLKETKKSLLQKMFPKDGANVPEIRFAGFIDAWEQCKYGEVIDLLSGQDFSPSEYNDTCNGIPYMTGASCIVGKETIVNRWTTVPRCLAEKGDVLLVCKGSGYGAIAVMAQDKAHIARQFMALKPLPNLDKVFNFYLLNSVIENIKKDARGLIVGIARDAVLKQEISIPLLAEQSRIGSLLKTLDDIITLHQRELDLLKNLKKSLLQQMFI